MPSKAICIAFAAICPALLCQSYTFTKIVELPSSPYPTDQTVTEFPAISDSGAVAYTIARTVATSLPLPSFSTRRSAFVSEAGAIRQLGDSSLSTTVLDITKSGTVLFAQAEIDGKARLLVDKGGSISQVEYTGDGRYALFLAGSMNDFGDVTFSGLTDEGVLGVYVKRADGTTVVVAEGADFRQYLTSYEPRINEGGSVGFSDNVAGGAVYLSTNGQFSNLTTTPSTVFGIGTVFASPMINSSNSLVFAVPYGFGPLYPTGGIFRLLYGKTFELVFPGKGTAPFPRAATINDTGQIAYSVTTSNFTDFLNPLVYGVYTASPDLVITKVIESGDLLFGAKVTAAGPLSVISTSRYLNNSGQIAFRYMLDNKTQGIAVATPVR